MSSRVCVACVPRHRRAVEQQRLEERNGVRVHSPVAPPVLLPAEIPHLDCLGVLPENSSVRIFGCRDTLPDTTACYLEDDVGSPDAALAYLPCNEEGAALLTLSSVVGTMFVERRYMRGRSTELLDLSSSS